MAQEVVAENRISFSELERELRNLTESTRKRIVRGKQTSLEDIEKAISSRFSQLKNFYSEDKDRLEAVGKKLLKEGEPLFDWYIASFNRQLKREKNTSIKALLAGILVAGITYSLFPQVKDYFDFFDLINQTNFFERTFFSLGCGLFTCSLGLVLGSVYDGVYLAKSKIQEKISVGTQSLVENSLKEYYAEAQKQGL